MRAFPRQFANVVRRRWNTMVSGDYVVPPCPPKRLLDELLEVIFLASCAPEEAAFPQFNVVAVPVSSEFSRTEKGRIWPLLNSRPFDVSEMRRLAPAVDIRKSAIWIEWNSKGWRIAGLLDLGTSWYRAKMGLEYRYRFPSCLLVQVERPGSLRVYQGAYHVATLRDGGIDGHKGIDLHLSLHDIVRRGLKQMAGNLRRPKQEYPGDVRGFEFIALWNTFAGIANSIRDARHGGSIIIAPSDLELRSDLVKIKYPLNSSVLRDAFISFMNARHATIDHVILAERKKPHDRGKLFEALASERDAQSELVEATRFIAHSARCDGAIVISEDIRFLGFGGEIRAEMKAKTKAFEVFDEMRRKKKRLDIEQFGMRHRSAIKLVSQQPRCRVLTISQDGPISAVWADQDAVLLRKGINLVNSNMPWAAL